VCVARRNCLNVCIVKAPVTDVCVMSLQVHDLEFAQIEVQVVQGLKDGNAALKKINQVWMTVACSCDRNFYLSLLSYSLNHVMF